MLCLGSLFTHLLKNLRFLISYKTPPCDTPYFELYCPVKKFQLFPLSPAVLYQPHNPTISYQKPTSLKIPTKSSPLINPYLPKTIFFIQRQKTHYSLPQFCNPHYHIQKLLIIPYQNYISFISFSKNNYYIINHLTTFILFNRTAPQQISNKTFASTSIGGYFKLFQNI